jgi:hypothetical protein
MVLPPLMQMGLWSAMDAEYINLETQNEQDDKSVELHLQSYFPPSPRPQLAGGACGWLHLLR